MFTNMNSMIRHGVIGAVALATLVTTTGCDERDVAAGVIIGGIIGGVVAGIGSDNDHERDRERERRARRERRCRGGYERQCRETRDYRGRRHRDCREVYNSCIGYYSSNMAPQSEFLHQIGFTSNTAVTNGVDSSVAEVANKWDISFNAAQTLVDALEGARSGQAGAIHNLGLNNNDFVTLGQGDLPESESIKRMAQTLDIESTQARSILEDFLAEAKAQMQDAGSAVWQACMAAGSWKTPQNASCKKDWWSGCSPATGATSCIPAN